MLLAAALRAAWYVVSERHTVHLSFSSRVKTVRVCVSLSPFFPLEEAVRLKMFLHCM